MLRIYFDASALCKRYLEETGTPFLNEVFRLSAPEQRMCFALGTLEVISILVRKRNDGRVSRFAFQRAMAAFTTEVVEDESFLVLSVDDSLVLRAPAMIQHHGLNATDALVLRSALDTREVLQRQGDELLLLSADKRLLRAGGNEGLLALDPEVEPVSRLQEILQERPD